jgi:ABC-type dipeptide/oligopeptide/nickel transport system permease subunit
VSLGRSEGDAPHLLSIAILVLGFNFLGDGLRDGVDPKLVK